MAGRTFLNPIAAVLRTPQRIFREIGDLSFSAGATVGWAFSSVGLIKVSQE
jgi:hypothetical protein